MRDAQAGRLGHLGGAAAVCGVRHQRADRTGGAGRACGAEHGVSARRRTFSVLCWPLAPILQPVTFTRQ
jgi:hypothetical protein